MASRPLTLTHRQAGFAITVPVALYLVAVWALHARYKAPSFMRNYAVPVAAALVVAAAFTSEPVLVTGGLLAALVALNVAVGRPVATVAGG